MKILLTGSSGHLGEALARAFKAANHEVVGLDLKPSPFTDRVGSIADLGFVKTCLKSVDTVVHTATLHKPQVGTHTRQQFVDTNITGTLNLLEAALLEGATRFVFTSTTSTFGDALTPPPGQPAAWITEDVTPIPKNIYGATKTAAEDLCQLFYRNNRLPCLILRTSRFFFEEDDHRDTRLRFQDGNVKANELLFRRVDLADVVSAHFKAIEKATEIGFGKYIISATSPFTPADLELLHKDAPAVVKKHFPDYEDAYGRKGWIMFPKIGRVYVNEKARRELGWQPKHDFRHLLDCLMAGQDPRSPLSIAVGSKRYHAEQFEDGPYPVE